MEKVYCRNCKYLGSYEGEMGEFGYLCFRPLNITKKRNAIHEWEETIHSPEIINRNNDCNGYKRKWYKFWVKK